MSVAGKRVGIMCAAPRGGAVEAWCGDTARDNSHNPARFRHEQLEPGMTDEPRSPEAEEARFRYEEIADLITGLVAEGTLAPGTRAPSLRELCRQQRTSLTTALQAYRL